MPKNTLHTQIDEDRLQEHPRHPLEFFISYTLQEGYKVEINRVDITEHVHKVSVEIANGQYPIITLQCSATSLCINGEKTVTFSFDDAVH